MAMCLLKVKFGRLNLEGEQSGWFWEIIRIVKTIKQIYGFSFPLKFVAENVASMDAPAEAEITATLQVIPWRMDSADVAPIRRPRLCWTNAELHETEGVWVEEKSDGLKFICTTNTPHWINGWKTGHNGQGFLRVQFCRPV